MAKSKSDWLRIIQDKTDYQIAQLALNDLVGYRHTSLRRADDTDNLTALLEAVTEKAKLAD